MTAAAAFTVTNAYALHIESPSVGAASAITNAYGLLIENQAAGGTLNYAIKTGTGLVDLGGELRLSASNTVSGSVLSTVTNKIKVNVGGTDYYLLANTSDA